MLGEANLSQSHLRDVRQYFDTSSLAGSALASPLENG